MTQSHPSAEVLARFRRGELDPREMLSIDEHLAACDECHVPLSSGDVEEKWHEALTGAHLTYDDMERWLDGRASDGERAEIEAHIASCEMCNDELHDLRSVTRPPRKRAWVAYAIAACIAGIVILILLLRPAPAPTAPPVVRKVTPPPATQTTPVEPQRDTFAEALQHIDPALRTVAVSLMDGTLPSEQLLQSLRAGGGRERSIEPSSGELAVVSPVGVVVDDDRPLFRWTGTPPFTVEIFDDHMQLVAATKRIDDTEWKATSALPRGKTLMWQVRRDRNGSSEIAPRPPAPPARFRIVTTEAQHAIDAAASPLEAALLYAREGMVEEAREKLRQAGAAMGMTPEVQRMMKTLDARVSDRGR